MIHGKMKTGLLGAATATATAAIVALIPWQPAKATMGMLPQCVGTYNCGMGGAGLALGTDATSAVINPALGSRLGNDAMLSVGWFSAQVKSTLRGGYGNTVYQGVEQKSDASQFANGSLGVNYRLTPKWSANVSLFPGGGGATDWKYSRTGNKGVESSQSQDRMIRLRMFMGQLSAAYKYTNQLSVGLGIIFSKQDLITNSLDNGFNKAKGGAPGTKDNQLGAGGQIGFVWAPNKKVSLAFDYRSQVYHQGINIYYNIFNGPIDTPPEWKIGISFKPWKGADIALDSRFINWKSVNSIGSDPSADGGFGWKNQWAWYAGIRQRLMGDKLTLRAGWAYAKSPIDENHVFANVLLPAIVEHHFNIGASYKLPWDKTEVGFSSYYAPEVTLRENGQGDAFSTGGVGTTFSHYQYGAQLSVKKTF